MERWNYLQRRYFRAGALYHSKGLKMSIRIDKINVRDLGPVRDLILDLGQINLIYSRNEKGKTFLAEFIIRSLFRNTKQWGYLRKGGSGKIFISGLEENPTEFSPSSKNKLEDYWETDEKGLNSSIAKLILVKGGETDIEDTDGGISKRLIKDILSSQKILDKIDNDSNISKTVKQAEIDEGLIRIKNMGEGSAYNSLLEELKEIERLFTEIENRYSEGLTAVYKKEEMLLLKQLEDQTKAKRYEAYLVSQKVRELKEELGRIPESALDQIITNISLFQRSKTDHNKLSSEYRELLEKGKHCSWMQAAFSEYKETAAMVIDKPGKSFLYSGIVLAAATAALLFFDQKIAGILSFTVMLAFIGIYIKKLQDAAKHTGLNEELNKIKEEFQRRTGNQLTDIALLEAALEEQKEFRTRSKAFEEQIKDLDREISDLGSAIKLELNTLAGEDKDEKDWHSTVSELKQECKNLQEMINENIKKLSRLNIDETDFIKENTGIRYSYKESEQFASKLQEIKLQIDNQKKQNSDLKFEISRVTGDDPGIAWEDLIENLLRKRQEKHEELKEVTAKIVAGITVHEVISELREAEDEKIQEGLESEHVLKHLQVLTQRYNRLSLEEDRLIISDDYESFDLRDLSTGAKELVMLALRLGFCSKILKDDSMFLILDDAFQHCDWQKREILVKQLTEIADKGWQIIYLTMDDHIKGLFEAAAKEPDRLKYKCFEL
ncbi:ATP-binding protein [candidate division KSB1 bacterium]